MAGRGRGRGLTLPSWMTSAPNSTIFSESRNPDQENKVPMQYEDAMPAISQHTTTPAKKSSESYSSPEQPIWVPDEAFASETETDLSWNSAGDNSFGSSMTSSFALGFVAPTPPIPKVPRPGGQFPPHIPPPIPQGGRMGYPAQQHQPPFQPYGQPPITNRSGNLIPPRFPGQTGAPFPGPYGMGGMPQSMPTGGGIMGMQQQHPHQQPPMMGLGIGMGHQQQQHPPSAMMGAPRGMMGMPPPMNSGGGGGMMGVGMGMPPGMSQGMPQGMSMSPGMMMGGGGGHPTQTPSVIGDPNNDVASWSDHETQDGRKYWFNRVTKTSTYDKPACLKTPEERAIPPCVWKEYVSKEGKKYYSNGTDSKWEMPEEYRVWLARVEAFERKKIMMMNSNTNANNGTGPGTDSGTGTGTGSFAVSTGAAGPTNASTSRNTSKSMRQGIDDSSEDILPVYKTREEAVEAFRNMLTDNDISSKLKFKEVQDICQSDVRWNAMKTLGERKQLLAEYQTKKMKLERESSKANAKKARDCFFQLLAQCTEIDSRSRYRDSIPLLAEDSRFKMIDDDREKEDLFNEFVNELLKKETEDRNRLKGAALLEFNNLLDAQALQGIYTRKSIWADCKNDEILVNILKNPSLHVLDDGDLRHAFQDFVVKLETLHREDEKKRKQEKMKLLQTLQSQFKALVVRLLDAQEITVDSRWKDVKGSIFSKDEVYIALEAVVEDGSSDGARGLFEDVIQDVKDSLRRDKRLVRDVLEDEKFIIEFDTTYESVHEIIQKKTAGLVSSLSTDMITTDMADTDTTADTAPHLMISSLKTINKQDTTKDKSKDSKISKDSILLFEMLRDRPQRLQQIFNEIQSIKIQEFQEKEKIQMKKEKKFIELLEDYYYRSDHIDTSWDDAKHDLQDHSSYLALERSDRKRLFTAHMLKLSEARRRAVRGIMTNTSVVEVEVEVEKEKITATTDTYTNIDTNIDRDIDRDEKKKKESKKKSNKDKEKEKDRHHHKHKHHDKDKDNDNEGKHKRAKLSHNNNNDIDGGDGDVVDVVIDSKRDKDREHSDRNRDTGKDRGNDRDRDRDNKDRDRDRDTDRDREVRRDTHGRDVDEKYKRLKEIEIEKKRAAEEAEAERQRVLLREKEKQRQEQEQRERDRIAKELEEEMEREREKERLLAYELEQQRLQQLLLEQQLERERLIREQEEKERLEQEERKRLEKERERIEEEQRVWEKAEKALEGKDRHRERGGKERHHSRSHSRSRSHREGKSSSTTKRSEDKDDDNDNDDNRKRKKDKHDHNIKKDKRHKKHKRDRSESMSRDRSRSRTLSVSTAAGSDIKDNDKDEIKIIDIKKDNDDDVNNDNDRGGGGGGRRRSSSSRHHTEKEDHRHTSRGKERERDRSRSRSCSRDMDSRDRRDDDKYKDRDRDRDRDRDSRSGRSDRRDRGGSRRYEI